MAQCRKTPRSCSRARLRVEPLLTEDLLVALSANKKRLYRDLGRIHPSRTIVAMWHRQRRATAASESVLAVLHALAPKFGKSEAPR